MSAHSQFPTSRDVRLAHDDTARTSRLAPHPQCRFCHPRSASAPWDTVLCETENFKVVPSKGGFIVGWVMIIARSHLLSMAQLTRSTHAELDALVKRVSLILSEKFAPPTIFEHGASVRNSTFGCGIDHAHLHIVPLPEELKLRASAEHLLGVPFKSQASANPQNAHFRIKEPGDSTFFIVEPSTPPPRQFFRQVLWKTGLFSIDSYDYDVSPCEDVVFETLKRLKGSNW